ncbi:hypothetical protein BCV70DRAFT_175093 [Testicularia cyperi]|uniref:Protein kinase domain-containing protein n=1 Tax=Testicularia cyperi TaxID=1882483 RepID=A0A317XRJ4_9BASI|nr:hypothetical protein BCV70DRAFT_175093 [Testicularia cyperi]
MRRVPAVSFADPVGDNAATAMAGSSNSTTRIPAAGLGTRTGPRPAPRSSASLRHVSSAKARTTGFSQPLPEDRDVQGDMSNYDVDLTASTVARQVDKEKRRAALFARHNADSSTDSDADDDEDEDEAIEDETRSHQQDSDQSVGSHGDGSRNRLRSGSASSRTDFRGDKDQFDYFSRSPSGYTSKGKAKASIPPPSNTVASYLSSASASASDDSDDWDTDRYHMPLGVAGAGAGAGTRSLAAQPDLLMAPVDPSLGIAPTPGPNFPADLHTPVDIGETETPILNPQHRMEWQIMLESVLNSEVLKSETKRINSVDTPDLTRQQLAYQRWLDIKATLRGRGMQRGAVDEEEKRLKEGFCKMLRELVDQVKACRADQIATSERRLSLKGTHDASTSSHLATGSVEGGDATMSEATATTGTSENEQSAKTPASETGDQSEKERALSQIGQLLNRIDSAEEQFPSTRKAIELVPEWGDADLRAKLAALYSWYNVTTSLRLQISILRKWTGSDSLEIASHQRKDGETEEARDPHDQHEPPRPRKTPAAENDSTFVERIQKEGSLQSTFEKRTLSSLYQLIDKAKQTILEFHGDFRRMALPSFEPELVTLINFPTRLMQGALRLRLDYAGKLAEPSVLIVDSLTDDLRAALAMACRVKLQYTSIIVADPERGWDLAPCIAEGYDAVLRNALKFFFKLLRLKLKASVYFKETEILEPEWRFLSTAVESIDGGDIIVATNITRFVNKLFDRIARYFNRELTATMTQHDQHGWRLPNPVSGPVGLAKSDNGAGIGPPGTAAGQIGNGKSLITIEDRAKWIHSVFDNVRIRSRKLLGFARDIRNRLDNAAEYDLGTLGASNEYIDPDVSARSDTEDHAESSRMTLSDFMLTLIDNDYFLVYTETLEEDGIYLVAEPGLQERPELIRDLVCKCLHRVRPGDEETAMAAEAAANALVPDGDEGDEGNSANPQALREQIDKQLGSVHADDDDSPRYILLLSPRDPFMWTGKVMHLTMPRVDITLADRRVRLVADGPKSRLELCKRHFRSIFSDGTVPAAEPDDGSDDGVGPFPLETLNYQMAHMTRVQSGLEDINKGVYMLSDTIIRKVPEIRRRLRGLGRRTARARSSAPRSTTGNDAATSALSGSCDELIQNCYSMAAEQGRRALPFIQSVRLRDQMTLALGRLAIDWIAFICDDCVPSERKTFRWAVSALGNANYITSAENIFRLNEQDFALLRAKVASCMALLISHFDILGARSSMAKAKEDQERLERDKAERNRLAGASGDPAMGLAEEFGALRIHSRDSDEQSNSQVAIALGPGTGAQSRVNKLDMLMQATEDRWIQKVLEWDAARSELEAEQRLIGRVLDDTRLEDRSLQFLAQSASKITIRWQQGQFIGGGTFGTVYLAVNLDSGGLMAVKEIRFQDISSTPGLYQQIRDEMEVMSMLSHPNIVEYYGIEVHRDRVYIFEEYCQGGSLAALLEHGRIEDETVIQVYTLQMVEGLIYLHSQGIIHRDIKPDNILLDHMGVLKFVDFGAAKILAKNSRTIQRSRKTGGGVGMLAAGGEGGKQGGPAGAMASLQGTPMYMSPEVIKGNSDGPQSAADIWSLGCVVLEFATGKRPWSNFDNEWAIMFHIGMAEQHPALPDSSQLSEAGIEFIRQCLTIQPRQRPSALQLKEDPWMRSLIEELDAANEAEAAAELAAGQSELTEDGSYSTTSSTSGSFNPHNAALAYDGNGGLPQTPGVGCGGSSTAVVGSGYKSLDRNVSSLNSVRSKWSAEMGSSSISSGGGTNLTSPYNPSMSLKASLNFRQSQLLREQQQAQKQAQQQQQPADQTEGAIDEAEGDRNSNGRGITGPSHVPGHPNHSHPGYSATYADMQYQKEEAERHAMLRNDSTLSSLPDES